MLSDDDQDFVASGRYLKRQTALARAATRHLWIYSLAAALFVGAYPFSDLSVSAEKVGSGAAAFLVCAFLLGWPGWVRRWQQRLYDEAGNLRYPVPDLTDYSMGHSQRAAGKPGSKPSP